MPAMIDVPTPGRRRSGGPGGRSRPAASRPRRPWRRPATMARRRPRRARSPRPTPSARSRSWPGRSRTARGRRRAGRRRGASRPDHLVDGVVAPDVLAGDERACRSCRTPRRRGRRRSRRTGSWQARHLVGHLGQDVEVERDRVDERRRGAAAAARARRCRTARTTTSSRARGAPGTGARPPVSTVTTLKPVVGRRAGRAVADAGDRRAAQEALGVAEAGGQLEVVARRAHGGRHQRAVEADLHRLLDDHLVGLATRRQAVPLADEHPLGAPPGHRAQATGPGHCRSSSAAEMVGERLADGRHRARVAQDVAVQPRTIRSTATTSLAVAVRPRPTTAARICVAVELTLVHLDDRRSGGPPPARRGRAAAAASSRVSACSGRPSSAGPCAGCRRGSGLPTCANETGLDVVERLDRRVLAVAGPVPGAEQEGERRDVGVERRAVGIARRTPQRPIPYLRRPTDDGMQSNRSDPRAGSSGRRAVLAGRHALARSQSASRSAAAGLDAAFIAWSTSSATYPAAPARPPCAVGSAGSSCCRSSSPGTLIGVVAGCCAIAESLAALSADRRLEHGWDVGAARCGHEGSRRVEDSRTGRDVRDRPGRARSRSDPEPGAVDRRRTQKSSMPPPGMAGASFSGLSATTASVVRNSAAIEAAFCSAERVTLAASMTPIFTRSS